MTAMTHRRTLLATTGLLGLGALALPAAAAAHPSVYETSARVAVTPATDPPTFTDQVRYVVANHGYTYVLRESNGTTTGGVVNYAKAPSALRSTPGYDVLTYSTPSAVTGAQAHATCDVPALTDPAAIRAWQGTDPFYAYVPFQRGSAGLEDHPADWLTVVQARTGVDLTQVADTDAAREAACEALPGATASSYVPADATQTTSVAFNSGLVADTIAATEGPLKAQIATFEQRVAELDAARRAAEARAAAAEAQAPAARPIAATLAAASITPTRIATRGLPVAVTGPAGQRVRVRATVTQAVARKLRLSSTVLGSKAAVLDRAGTATVTVKPGRAAGTRLRKATTKVPVRLDVVTGSVTATVAR
jgi:hypothetical protein